MLSTYNSETSPVFGCRTYEHNILWLS